MNISGSSAGRAAKCPASHALPQIIEPTSQAADRGNVAHNYIRCKLSNSAIPLVPPEYKDFVEAIDIASHVKGVDVFGTEMSYMLNLLTKEVKFLGSNIGRAYPEHGPYEIPLTIDVVGFTKDKVPVELDWKTGQWTGEVEDNWQRRLCAAVLLLKFDTSEVISRNVYLREDGSSYTDTATFTIMDIYAFLDEFKGVVDAVLRARLILSNGGIPDTYPGDHCEFCNAKPFCPAKTAIVKTFSTDLQPLIDKLAELPPRKQGEVMVRVKEIKKLAEYAETVLKEAAYDHPLPVGDEHEYRVKEKEKTYFDDSAARGLLKQLGATDDDIAKLYKVNRYKEVRKLKVIK